MAGIGTEPVRYCECSICRSTVSAQPRLANLATPCTCGPTLSLVLTRLEEGRDRPDGAPGRVVSVPDPLRSLGRHDAVAARDVRLHGHHEHGCRGPPS